MILLVSGLLPDASKNNIFSNDAPESQKNVLTCLVAPLFNKMVQQYHIAYWCVALSKSILLLSIKN